jgi:hypothetical protein
MIEEIIEAVTTDPIDLVATNGQLQTRAFQYKLLLDGKVKNLVVLSPSGTTAHEGINQQFPNGVAQYMGVSDIIMQVNNNSIIEG